MSGSGSIKLAIASIRRDGGTQIRAQISLDVAKEYAEAMVRGDRLPPIGVCYDGTDNYVWDGYHRLMAAELAGAATIDAVVTPGTRRDAILKAVGANAAHGYRRSNADKRQAVMTLLDDPEWSAKSDREIARLCHVGADMVGRLRPPPPPASVGERRTPAKREVTRGGKVFVMDVASINRERAPAVAPPPVPNGDDELRRFLGELRAGADVKSAAVAAGMGMDDARKHAFAEAHQKYPDIVAIEPGWSIEGEGSILVLTAGVGPAEIQPGPANDDVPPPSFDFASAQMRDAAVQAIVALSVAPPAEILADQWANYTGRGVPIETVVRARAWLDAFAELFPAAEACRQAAITAKLETI